MTDGSSPTYRHIAETPKARIRLGLTGALLFVGIAAADQRPELVKIGMVAIILLSLAMLLVQASEARENDA